MDYSNKTALITGASSGLGVEYAREFATRGSKLVLVARRKDALEKLATELRDKFGISVETISKDLSTLSAGQELASKLKTLGIEVDILVNNAGFGTSGRFVNENADKVKDEISLNVITLVELTRTFLPGMLAKNSGAVVNIASTAAYQPVPGMAVYAATKAFVLSFTSALWGETKNTGVRVLAVSPGATATEFFDVAGAKPSSELAPAADVIKTTFKALDAKRSAPSVIDGNRNSTMAKLSKFLPTKLVIGVAASLFLDK